VISVKSSFEIDKMRVANGIVGELLERLYSVVKPGVTTLDIDEFCRKFILKRGAKAAFKNYSMAGLPDFPGNVCISVNSCIVHGIAKEGQILREGDIVGIDIGTYIDGYYGDGARTYAVGNISKSLNRLIKITKEALDIGVDMARDGNRVGDISYSIGNYIKKNGYYVADNLTGHGIGAKLHEDPMIPNCGKKSTGARLKSGMTLAIEPMVNIGTNRVIEKGWECMVADGSCSAHFENTILVTDGFAEILTKGL